MTSPRRSLAVTSLGLHYDYDYDVAMHQPISEGITDRDFMRINVHPQPLLARNGSENRNFLIPRSDTEWIQMVNRFNSGRQEMYYPAKSIYPRPPGPKPVRSISANSYFDPFTLRTDVAGKIARAENEMTRMQMQRAYQRACNQPITSSRKRASPLNDPREGFPGGEEQDSPILRTRTAPLTTRLTKSLISENTSGYCTADESKPASSFPAQQEKQRLLLPIPPSASKSKLAGNLPSRKEAWYSTPYRAKIVKQSPPWRSLMNRRPQGVRAKGELCPNYCRCCFEDTYDTNNKNVFKIDLK